MSEISQKWGEIVADRGFSQVPNYLLLLNTFIDPDLRLSPLELLLLIQLSGSWWKKDEQPFPAMRTLATRCGTSERQVLRAIARLEELKLISRVKRRSRGLIASNSYDLSPLVETLSDVAREYPNIHPRRTEAKAAPEVEVKVKPRPAKVALKTAITPPKPMKVIMAKAAPVEVKVKPSPAKVALKTAITPPKPMKVIAAKAPQSLRVIPSTASPLRRPKTEK